MRRRHPSITSNWQVEVYQSLSLSILYLSHLHPLIPLYVSVKPFKPLLPQSPLLAFSPATHPLTHTHTQTHTPLNTHRKTQHTYTYTLNFEHYHSQTLVATYSIDIIILFHQLSSPELPVPMATNLDPSHPSQCQQQCSELKTNNVLIIYMT